MTPYHHYPRVRLEYCRCVNCGNDLRDRILSRIFIKLCDKIPNISIPKYKLKRISHLASKKSIRSLKRLLNPPYKQRRVHHIAMQKSL